MFTRVLISSASDRFFCVHKPLALKLWGELRFDFGRICYESVVKKYGSGECVFFYYPVGVDGGIGYGPQPVDAIDLYFIHGEIDRKWHKIAGEKSIQVVAGYPRDTLLKDFLTVTREDSLKSLGLAQKTAGDTYLFYASSPVIRGAISLAEYHAVGDAMIAYASKIPHLKLILKPHPNDNAVLFQKICEKYGNPANVMLLDKSASPYQCINASDIIVTKYSTVALEAMRLRKPVISLALDGDKRFQDIFEDAVEKFQDSTSCVRFIGSLLNDPEKLASWVKATVDRQDAFLPLKMYTPPISVEKIIVDTVLGTLEEHGNPMGKSGLH